jgi:hypothetical protein
MEQTNATESNQPTAASYVPLARILAGIFIMVPGAAVFFVGFVLRAAQECGAFPLFSFAGGITILSFFVGAAIFTVGAILAGARAVIGLGAILILAGLGIWLFWFLGLAGDALLSVLLPFAGVLVAMFGFTILAAWTGWLDRGEGNRGESSRTSLDTLSRKTGPPDE